MKLAVVIFAAGLGTRMKSPVPKVLHSIFGKPMIQYVADSVIRLKALYNIVVIGHGGDAVKNALRGYPFTFVVQNAPMGTGDAMKVAARRLKGFKGTVLVLNGDTPLITTPTLQKFLSIHKKNKEDISIISFIAKEPSSYGRIIRETDIVRAIVEDRDADERQKMIKEVNSGIYAIESHMLKFLSEIKINQAKGEYYLTDIIDIAIRKGYKVGAHIIGDEKEFVGVNTMTDLYNATHYMRERIISRLLDSGVSFVDKTTVYIHPHVEIGTDTLIYPNVYIEGKSSIGKKCIILPNTRITDSKIGNHVVIKDSTVIESSEIKDEATVGPFAHIRHGSIIGTSSRIGNFVEIKKSVIGRGVKASHLSYLGDSEIADGVNIGAGTITCNYDGMKKNKTIIEEGVFIGSDSQLIAPVRIGKGAYVGAGSTITKDVPPMSLAISRTEQKNIEGWVLKKSSRQSSKIKKEEKNKS